MIEDAIVDAYTESEQAVGVHATIDRQYYTYGDLKANPRDLNFANWPCVEAAFRYSKDGSKGTARTSIPQTTRPAGCHR